MKNIKDLTEQEILNLSSEEVDKMVKFRMAEEGIKFIDCPEKPIDYKIQPPTTKAYFCHLLGQRVSFTDIEELTSVVELLGKCTSLCTVESEYSVSQGYRNFIKEKVENATYSSETPYTITSISVYTYKEFGEIKENLKANAQAKKDFQGKLEEYNAVRNDSQWIRDEVIGRVEEVVHKYAQLKSYYNRFKNEYLPLADGNTEIALNFMDKACSLTDGQKEYIIANHED